jgi:hypothetical protein
VRSVLGLSISVAIVALREHFIENVRLFLVGSFAGSFSKEVEFRKKYIQKWQADGELFLRGGANYVGVRYLKWASEFEAESNKLKQFEDELDVVQGLLMSLGF